MRLETNLVLTPTGKLCNPWEIILKKHKGIFFFHINYHILGWAEDSEKNL